MSGILAIVYFHFPMVYISSCFYLFIYNEIVREYTGYEEK